MPSLKRIMDQTLKEFQEVIALANDNIYTDNPIRITCNNVPENAINYNSLESAYLQAAFTEIIRNSIEAISGIRYWCIKQALETPEIEDDHVVRSLNLGGQIQINFEKFQESYQISILDNGKDLPFMFEFIPMRFWYTSKYPGSPKDGGKGLKIAKSNIEALGGEIYFENKNRNTVVYIELPLRD